MPVFDPSLVAIARHRLSVTQGEVSVYYDGRLIDRYGDTVSLLRGGEAPPRGADPCGGWAGLGDDCWLEAARRNVEETPMPYTTERGVTSYRDRDTPDEYATGRDEEASRFNEHRDRAFDAAGAAQELLDDLYGDPIAGKADEMAGIADAMAALLARVRALTA